MKKRNSLLIVSLCVLALLAALTACGKKTPEETEHVHVWDDGTENYRTPCEGETVYVCTVCGETKAEPFEKEHVWTEEARLVKIPEGSTAGECERICTKCNKTGGTVSMKLLDYNRQVNALSAKVNAFSIGQFGGPNVTEDLASIATKTFAAPPKTPIARHPRVLLNESDLAGIRTALKEDRNRAAAKRFFDGIVSLPTGELGPEVKHEKGTYKYLSNCTYNYDDEMLKDIQSLALDYQLTGNKISGYGAILAIKNYILTLIIKDVTSDPERQYGAVMYTAACVYDWCYDLLSPADKLQIVSGVEHKIVNGSHMEMGFPPEKQYAVAGHGCEYQLMRDYLAFAIAIYDEYPGWWNFIAGRFYQQYIESRNEFYEGGMVSQGVSLYVRVRFASDLFSAWLLKAATGEFPYNADDMKNVMRSIYAYELPNGGGFAMGDSHETKIDGDFINYGLPAMMAAYLFNDETIRAQLESRPCCYTKFFDEDQDCFEYGSVTEYLICSSSGVKAADDVHKDMDLICYNGGWLGQIIARNGWGDDQATVLMKIGVKTAGNHDHMDQGQFQIWYKGMLAGDTGVYDSYSSDHERYYHRQTIAHNCVLVRNPNATDPSNSGGQIRIGGNEMSDTDFKNVTKTKTGELIGVAYDYLDAAKTKPKYAYIAGDISASYDVSAATEVQRRMLVVYDTKNENVPMYFFVFDGITAKYASDQKVFLLHTRTEPMVDGNTVTEINGDARLVLQSVFGGDNVVKVGGENNNYNVNGTQYPANPDATSREDGFWGRVEIYPTPQTGVKTDQLLNVIYVCDANKRPNLPATKIEAEGVKGAVIGSVAAVFVTKLARQTEAFSFAANGAGDLTYYVSGVKAGAWTVAAGGQTQTVTATEDGGLLVFTAPAGAVTLTPQ